MVDASGRALPQAKRAVAIRDPFAREEGDAVLISHAGRSTHPGHRRSRNEDASLVGTSVFCVADGMGGHADGNVAAAIAVEELARVDGPNPQRSHVLGAIREADTRITEAATDLATGMGTTITGVVVPGTASGQLLVFNVGDSRVYRLRAGQLLQLTTDHSVVQELIDDGALTPADAAVHPERNVITRSLGSGGPLDIDWWMLDVAPGDRILVASDGLSKEVDDDAIATALGNATGPQEIADALVAAALDGGGRDNVTVVVVDLAADPAEDEAPLDQDTAPSVPLDDGTEVDTTPRDVLGATR
jgi:protein phosphatase